jgi:prepilin-type N-terminal cleavage/methylation domain-containing protein
MKLYLLTEIISTYVVLIMKKKRKLNESGFSLIELIIVIAIIAILTGIIAPAYIRYVGRSKVVACQENRRQTYNEAYTNRIGGDFDSLEASLTASVATANEKKACPTGGTYSFVLSDDGETGYIVCSEHGGDAGDNGDEPTPGPDTPSGGGLVADGSNTGDTDYEKAVYNLFSNGWSEATLEDGKVSYKKIGDFLLVYELDKLTNQQVTDFAESQNATLIQFDGNKLNMKYDSDFNDLMAEQNLGGYTIKEVNFNSDHQLVSVKYKDKNNHEYTYYE